MLKETAHWYLELGRIKDEWLADWFASKTDDWKVNVRHFVKIQGLAVEDWLADHRQALPER